MDLGGMASLASLEGAVAVGRLHGGRREVHMFNGAAASSRFRIASLTKTFTCVATLRAARTQSVSLDTPLIEVLAHLAPSWAADPSITIRTCSLRHRGSRPTSRSRYRPTS